MLISTKKQYLKTSFYVYMRKSEEYCLKNDNSWIKTKSHLYFFLNGIVQMQSSVSRIKLKVQRICIVKEKNKMIG